MRKLPNSAVIFVVCIRDIFTMSFPDTSTLRRRHNLKSTDFRSSFSVFGKPKMQMLFDNSCCLLSSLSSTDVECVGDCELCDELDSYKWRKMLEKYDNNQLIDKVLTFIWWISSTPASNGFVVVFMFSFITLNPLSVIQLYFKSVVCFTEPAK